MVIELAQGRRSSWWSGIDKTSPYNKPLQQTARPSTALRAAPVRPQLKGVVLGRRGTASSSEDPRVQAVCLLGRLIVKARVESRGMATEKVRSDIGRLEAQFAQPQLAAIGAKQQKLGEYEVAEMIGR